MAALVITAAELMTMMKTITRGTDGRTDGRAEEGVAGLLAASARRPPLHLNLSHQSGV